MQEKYRRTVKRKSLAVVAVCALILLILVVSRWSGGRGAQELLTQQGRIDYLAGLGLKADASTEEFHTVQLPAELSDVLTEYNELQISQGFDLAPYCGVSVDQYTYELRDYGEDGTVYATLYILNGAVIAGDVHSAELGGFMRGLVN